MTTRPYALLTSAKNEEQYIGDAIESVARQVVLPTVWLMVDDGSTDRTAEIISNYARRHSFIRLHSCSKEPGRSFASQYKAIQAAYGMIRDVPFDYVGVHDADIAVQGEHYYEQIINEFERSETLGITGGMIYEKHGAKFANRKGNSLHSVAGGIQMFRRECFEQIGGYTPLPLGGSDWLAQINARRMGWDVRALPELHAFHYRPTATATGRMRGWFRLGMLTPPLAHIPFSNCLNASGASPASRRCLAAWFSFADTPGGVLKKQSRRFLRKQSLFCVTSKRCA